MALESSIRSLALLTRRSNPAAFALCVRWMRRQTIRLPVTWYIHGSAKPEADAEVLRQGWRVVGVPTAAEDDDATLAEFVACTDADALVIIDERTWYAPTFLERVAEQVGRRGLVAIDPPPSFDVTRRQIHRAHRRRTRNTAVCAVHRVRASSLAAARSPRSRVAPSGLGTLRLCGFSADVERTTPIKPRDVTPDPYLTALRELTDSETVDILEPFGRHLDLIDLWQRHLGATIAVLGNGWSLAGVDPEDLRKQADVIIGVNRIWRWGPVDYWLAIDRVIFDEVEQARPSILQDPVWLTPANQPWRFGPHPENWVPLERRFANDVPSPGLTEDSLISTAIERGGREPCPLNVLWANATSVTPCLHLALILGARRIRLYGVDLAHRSEGARYFFQDPRSKSGRLDKRTDRNFRRFRSALEQFAETWASELTLECVSPTAKLAGWRGLDESSWTTETEDVGASPSAPPPERNLPLAEEPDRDSRDIAILRRSEWTFYRKLYADHRYGAATRRHDATLRFLESFGPLSTCRSWLDVGSGGFDVSEFAAARGIRLVRTDPGHPDGADVPAHRVVEEWGARAFDVVTAFDVLEHLLPEELDDCHRALLTVSRHGVLVSIGAHRSALWAGRHTHLTVLSPRQWLSRLKSTWPDVTEVGRLGARTPIFWARRTTDASEADC